MVITLDVLAAVVSHTRRVHRTHVFVVFVFLCFAHLRCPRTHKSDGFAQPPPRPPGMRTLLDARPLREGCIFVVALQAAAGAPRGGGEFLTQIKKD